MKQRTRADEPMWLLELRYMARADKPLFVGLLEEEDGAPRWTKDEKLTKFLENQWVEIIEGGFVITARGLRICEKF